MDLRSQYKIENLKLDRVLNSVANRVKRCDLSASRLLEALCERNGAGELYRRKRLKVLRQKRWFTRMVTNQINQQLEHEAELAAALQAGNLRIEQTETATEQEGINALLELLGYDPITVMTTDLSTFLDFLSQFEYETLEEAQEFLDTILPVSVPAQYTLIQGLEIIRRSLPNWPRPTLFS